MIIKTLKESAKEVGINAFITDSQSGIDTQLNRLTREEDLPIMLVSWDIRAQITFNQHGYIDNPPMDITALLVTKPEEIRSEAAEEEAENMAQLFIKFLQNLADKQRVLIKTNQPPITNASYQLVPWQGTSKHSGVLGSFTIKGAFDNKC